MWPTHPAHHGAIPTKARLVAPLWLQGGVARATRALGVGRNRLAAGCCLGSTYHQTPARHSRCAARSAHVARAGGLHGLVLLSDSCAPGSVAPSTTDPAHTIRKGARLCLPLPAGASGAAAKCIIDVLIFLCNFVTQNSNGVATLPVDSQRQWCHLVPVQVPVHAMCSEQIPSNAAVKAHSSQWSEYQVKQE